MRRTILSLLMLFILSLRIFPDPNPETMIKLYEASENLDYKLKTLQEMTQYTEETYRVFFADLIRKLATRFDRDPYLSRPYFTRQLLQSTLQEVRKYSLEESAQWVNFIRTRTDDGPTRRDAIYTLGELNAVVYAPKLTQRLNACNQFTGGDADLEAEAQACILTIGKLQYVKAIPVLYRAWNGWYSKAVAETALNVLYQLAPDPTPWLLNLAAEGSLEDFDKLIAIELNSEADRISQRELVRSVFIRTIKYIPNDPNQEARLIASRILAMDTLRELGSDADQEVEYCRELLITSGDTAEKAAAVRLLAAGGGSAGIEALSSYLQTFRKREESGYTAEDHGLIKLAITELGRSGGSEALEALIAIKTSEFPAAIVKLAGDTIDSMQE